ncbi:glycosyltransferase [Alicyclobacillus sp. ALC3]|uniref:glycosyltransferase n=1 Tax=Alicyclobacillus sp. ALC3 TaxID=2796143 RepID=UPI002379EAAC|nr:glycosyltransferase [Alicyclobacillus sp. ALC3]WDL95250.1 glycosyltransferase [Alicyclobacillus sp. ALC3]
MKVVIVHDYLNQRGGAERVVAVLHEMYPEAPIYTLFVDRAKLWPAMRDATIIPSILQRFPFIVNHFKLFFWLYPFAIRTLRLPPCDVIITSSSAYAKGVRLPRRGSRPVHACYCHTPMRFAWDYDRYIAHETNSRFLARMARVLVPSLKWWDVHTSRQVDAFITNSTAVKDRVQTLYHRDAVVIHPPVDTNRSTGVPLVPGNTDYYLLVARLVSYKRLDLAVRACTSSARNLVVIGTGPDLARLQSMAGPTVQFVGWQTDAAVDQYMSGCRALLFPGEEDFGIAPIEANATGKPVVAYRAGGALDTIQHGVNGIHFADPTVESLLFALAELETKVWDAAQIRRHAAKFSHPRFERQFRTYIERLVANSGRLSRDVTLTVHEGGIAQ